jgi:hypothetical protein
VILLVKLEAFCKSVSCLKSKEPMHGIKEMKAEIQAEREQIKQEHGM